MNIETWIDSLNKHLYFLESEIKHLSSEIDKLQGLGTSRIVSTKRLLFHHQKEVLEAIRGVVYSQLDILETQKLKDKGLTYPQREAYVRGQIKREQNPYLPDGNESED